MGTKTIVYTSGSWDLFHVGHLNVLRKSKSFGDYLVVGVSTDELIEDYKGTPPIIPFDQRFQIIESIKFVDKVVKQTILTEIDQLKDLNVDIVTIGDDWKDKYLEGLDWMESQDGKKVEYLKYTEGVSTTSIKRKIIDNIYEIISADFKRENMHIEEWKQRQKISRE